MSLRIENNSMSLEVDGRIVAMARLSEHAAADRQGRGSSRPAGRVGSSTGTTEPSQVTRLAQITPGVYQGVSRS
jgi:hypothetical protein